MAVEPFLFKLINKDERYIPNLIKIIKQILNNLPESDLERRVFLRKFTGEDNLKGILDFIPQDTKIVEFNKLDVENEVKDEKFIIGPLNMDELTHFYKKILKNNLAIYPFTHNLLNSKFYRNIMFYPFVPEMIYVPEFSNYHIKNYDFNKFFKDRNVERVILKDEFGYHGGQIIHYQVVNVDKINEELMKFKEKVRTVEDFGGIIVEEFLSGLKSEVYKCHIFGELIPDEILKYNVQLKGLEGIFKSYTKYEPQLLDDVITSVGNIPQEIFNKLNPFIVKHLPYSFSSFDFILDDDKPVVIDVNSKAGSLGEIQEIIGSNKHNPFDFFYKKCLKFSNNEFEKQMEFLNLMEKTNLKIRNLDGIYSASKSKIYNLLNNEEINLS